MINAENQKNVEAAEICDALRKVVLPQALRSNHTSTWGQGQVFLSETVEIESRRQDLPEEYDLDGCVRLFALCEMD